MAMLFTLFAPAGLYLPFILVGIIIFPLYLEAIPLALFVDVVYGGAGHGAVLFGYPFGISAAVLILFALPLRKHVRFHA